jgi:formylglycine-generating enzyme required for sulfatase activity
MKTRSTRTVSFLPLLCLSFCAVGPPLAAQTPLGLNLQLDAGQAQLTITGAVDTVCQVQWTDNFSATSRWFHLEHAVLASSPVLVTDSTASVATNRYYRAVWTPNTNFVWIWPGTFTMGSPSNEAGRSTIEGPQGAVTISQGFWMGKYLVTQGDYLAVVGINPSYFNGDRSGPPWFDQDYGTDLTLPVEQVSWHDATNYCAALTAQERVAGRLPANSAYRLPTEAEWEYACRAGTTTRFYYGDDPGYTNLNNYAWFVDNSNDATQPVGQLLPNGWGLYDTSGNVWEWCRDWYDLYSGGSLTDPQGPATGTNRVVRGGAYYQGAQYCRSARRFRSTPDFTYSGFGFRVVLAFGQP